MAPVVTGSALEIFGLYEKKKMKLERGQAKGDRSLEDLSGLAKPQCCTSTLAAFGALRGISWGGSDVPSKTSGREALSSGLLPRN